MFLYSNIFDSALVMLQYTGIFRENTIKSPHKLAYITLTAAMYNCIMNCFGSPMTTYWLFPLVLSVPHVSDEVF